MTERERRMGDTVPVGVDEAGLPAVRVRKPAEEMVERAVLHHHHDDVLEPRALGSRERCRAK